MKALSLAILCVLSLSVPAGASILHLRRAPHRGSNVTLRKRLHINDLITEPGTIEIDWGNLYSMESSEFTMPSAFKYTPAGTSVLWGRTEYSVAFDSVSSSVVAGARTTQFSDRITMTATSVVLDTTHFDVALAPQATFFLRDGSGARYGATAIARADIGQNSVGGTAGWTAATSSSSVNPAGTWDIGAGLGRHLASKGALSRFTPHMNAVWERSTGFAPSTALFAGVEYQATQRVGIDVSGQRIGSPGFVDRQVLLGMTINLGNPLK